MKLKPRSIRAVKAEVQDGWLYMESMTEKPITSSHGKYLFFSEDPISLGEISAEILEKFKEVTVTKMSTTPVWGDYVLCVFCDNTEELTKEFREVDGGEIKFRGWKSNQDTIDGNYSEEFLSKI